MWFITSIEYHTHVDCVYLLKEKSKASQVFQFFHSMIKTQYNKNIQVFHTNNGTEYLNMVLGKFLIKNGMIHQSFYVNTPQQNKILERKNCHILEVARALMFIVNIPKYF